LSALRPFPAIFAAAVLTSVPGSGAAAPEGSFVLRVGRVYTGVGPVLEHATVVVRGGKIVAVGRDVEPPSDLPLLEFPRHSLIPGLIDAETSLTGEASDVDKSLSPEILAADGWDYYGDRRALLRGGVTTVYVSPGISTAAGRPTRLVSGRGCVVKTGGSNADPLARLIRPIADVQVTLGDLPKRPPSIYDPPIPPSPDNPFQPPEAQLPQTRPGEFLALRGLLDDAERCAGVGKSAGGPAPRPTQEAAAMISAVRGDEPLRFRANRARDILQVLALSSERGLKAVIEGGREADLLAPELAAAKVPVIFAGGFQPGQIAGGDLSVETREGRYREEALMALTGAGVKIVLHSPTDLEAGDLLLEAASAVRAGLSPADAIRSVTFQAAEVLGVADRVGSIAPGKDADLVLLGSDPFEADARPQAVWISGDLAYHDGPRGLGPDATIIRTRAVWNGKGDAIPGGVVVVEKGKIKYVGPGALCATLSQGARVVDAVDEIVAPGFIDAGTTAGARAEALVAQAAAQSGAAGGGGRSTFRLADALDPGDPALLDVVRKGITTILITPEPSAPISGQVTAWKLSGKSRDAVTLKSEAGLLLRSDLQPGEVKKAKDYDARWKAWEASHEGEAPEQREELEPFRRLFEKKAPAVVYAPTFEAGAGFARMLATDFGMNVVVVGGGRADSAADELAKAGAAALITVPFVVQEGSQRIQVARKLAASGLRFAVRSGVASAAGDIVAQVGFAVREGWSAQEALSALSLSAARIFGVDDRVGSLEVGKDADIVFLSGEPFAPGTRVTRVMVEGEWR